jgi:hypothetical protein
MRRAAVVQLCLAATIVAAWLAPAPPSPHGPQRIAVSSHRAAALPSPGEEATTVVSAETDSTGTVWLDAPAPLSTITGTDDPLIVHARALESFGPRPPPSR